jgi:CheY-like chemotaxis protein
MRVLVAEDDRGLRDVLARGLREKGYVVDPVADGQAGQMSTPYAARCPRRMRSSDHRPCGQMTTDLAAK